MAWQVLAIWAIVIPTVSWFFRDEKRLKAEADLARAARYYAHAPQYRHVPSGALQPIALPARRTGGLTEQQRAFLLALQKTPV